MQTCRETFESKTRELSMKRTLEEAHSDESTVPSVRIAVGSYEHILQGLDARLLKKDGRYSAVFDPVWSFEAHTGAVKALAAGGRYLASGGVDEIVKLYDLRRRKDLGSLLSHDGSITSIKFPKSVGAEQPQHMISGDENNRIIIWRIKNWSPMIQLTTRHGRVNDLSIHPSGKIALSVGSDINVRLWNLVTGKKAAAHSLVIRPQKGAKAEDCEGLKVRWNTAGDLYAILFDKNIRLYDMSAAVKHTISAGRSRFHDIQFLVVPESEKEFLAASLEDGSVHMYDATTLELVQELKSHTTRVKCLSIQIIKDTAANQELVILASASTDGHVKLWTHSSSGEWYEVGDYNAASARITCLALTDSGVERLDEVVKRRVLKNGEKLSDDSDVDVKEESESDVDALSATEHEPVAGDDDFNGFDD